MQYLETTRKNVMEATSGLSEAQWNFKPGAGTAGRWPSDGAHRRSGGLYPRMVKEKVIGAGRGRWA